MSPGTWLAVAAAGALGALARYVVDQLVSRRGGDRPFGTFVVNISGSFVLGLVTGLAAYRAFPATAKVVLGTGFLGAYTTFSTFALETVALTRSGERRAALWNLGGSLCAGIGAAAAGLALAAL